MIVFIQPAGKASMNRWMAKDTMRRLRRKLSVISRTASAWWRWEASTQPASVPGVS